MNKGTMIKTPVSTPQQQDIRREAKLEEPGPVAPVDHMLTTFTVAGRTHPEPLFYGIPVSEYAIRLRVRALRFVNGQG